MGNLNVWWIMLYVTPILVQSVIPCVMAGALTVTATDPTTKKLKEYALALAGGLQGVALLVAGYYKQKTIEEDYTTLSQPRDEDKELIEADEKADALNKEFEARTMWTTLQNDDKFLRLSAFFLSEVACFLLIFPVAECFK